MTEEIKMGDRVRAFLDGAWIGATIVDQLDGGGRWIVETFDGVRRIPSEVYKDKSIEVSPEPEKESFETSLPTFQTSDPRLIEVMKTVEKFLAGKMNVLLREENGFYEIVENQDKKLISLFGKSNGELQWELNKWSDGLGKNWNIYPFETQHEAEEFVFSRFEEIEKKWEETADVVCIHEASKILKKFGHYIEPSPAFSNAIKRHQIKILTDRRKDLIEKLAKVDQEFNDLYS